MRSSSGTRKKSPGVFFCPGKEMNTWMSLDDEH